MQKAVTGLWQAKATTSCPAAQPVKAACTALPALCHASKQLVRKSAAHLQSLRSCSPPGSAEA